MKTLGKQVKTHCFTLIFFIRILFIKIPKLKKLEKIELPRNNAQVHMQMHIRISPTKVFILLSNTMFFFHVVFQDQSEEHIDEDDIST